MKKILVGERCNVYFTTVCRPSSRCVQQYAHLSNNSDKTVKNLNEIFAKTFKYFSRQLAIVDNTHHACVLSNRHDEFV